MADATESEPDASAVGTPPQPSSCTACGATLHVVPTDSTSLSSTVWCRRCRAAAYCSAECKARDAEAHRAVCVAVKRGTCPPGYRLRGCAHYERGCTLVAPCCKEEYGCRMCHNTAVEDGATKCEETFDRSRVDTVVCLQCRERQPPTTDCRACGVDFGLYCCLKCRMFSDIDEGQFHCDGVRSCASQ